MTEKENASETTDAPSVAEQHPVETCSFCQQTKAEVDTLIAGPDQVFICASCVQACVDTLREQAAGKDPSALSGEHVFTLLGQHFAPHRPEQLVTASRRFPARIRPDIQGAVDTVLSEKYRNAKFIGMHVDSFSGDLTFPELWRQGNRSIPVGPLQYEDVDIGESVPVPCLKNALWLFIEGGLPCAVVLAQCSAHFHGTDSVYIEFAAPAGDAAKTLAERCFGALETAVNRSASYRGKVLSLESTFAYSGRSSAIKVHKIAPVARDQIVLPTKTLALLDRNVLHFVCVRQRLAALRMTVKKGLLFYGPPGTGKTHTVHYLASQLPGHTTFLITAEQILLLDEYVTLARLLQPSVVVIEDVDLIAKQRDRMGGPGEESLLNKLLNEMDGLREDAEITFLLTTNRPDVLEEALAARPGRIDQAIEFPLPDAAGRAKLVTLYARDLSMATPITETIVAKTAGVSAAFIKELMRRTAQFMIEDDAESVALNHVDAALEEMLFTGGMLNQKLLGGGGEPDAEA